MTTIVTTNSTSTTNVSSNDPVVIVDAVLVANVGIAYLEALGPTTPIELTITENALVSGAGGSGTTFGIKAMKKTIIANHGTIEGDVGIAFNIGNHTLQFGATETAINSGTIRASGTGHGAIEESVTDAAFDQIIVNSGLIVGDVALMLGLGNNRVQNTGTLTGLAGDAITTSTGADSVQNGGTIEGAIRLGDGANGLDNSGRIGGLIETGAGGDNLSNSGVVTGSVTLGVGSTAGEGGDSISNTGTIGGAVTLGGGAGSVDNLGTLLQLALGVGGDTVFNAGTISRGVTDLGGDDALTNTGILRAISGVAVDLAGGADRLVNGGKIVGDVALGDGTDIYDGRQGKVSGDVRGEAGADILRGGNSSDALFGGDGDDQLAGGGGSDLLAGGLGNDALNGGAGDDSFLFDSALNPKTNVDHITRFKVDDDVIQLDNAVFAKLLKTGTLGAGLFHESATGKAHDKTDRVIYETDTGKIVYDSNGSKAGGAVLFAIVDKGLDLSAANFEIV